MSKLKPKAPRKEEWDPNEWQGRNKEQVDSNNAVMAFAVICLLTTVVVAAIHEIYLWLSH